MPLDVWKPKHNKRNAITFTTGTADVDENVSAIAEPCSLVKIKDDLRKKQTAYLSFFISPIIWLGLAVTENTLCKRDFNTSLIINFHKIHNKKFYQA